MKRIVACLCFAVTHVSGIYYNNVTLDAVQMQLLDFKLKHPKPIGVLTTSAGKPVEIRESVTLNTDHFNNPHFWDLQTSIDHERIPPRVVHARGTGAFGYFEVTNDVSKYTKADVFNHVGKRTPVAVRFSVPNQHIGGSDLTRDVGALAAKFYTNEGNLDLLSLSVPLFFFNMPHMFPFLPHAMQKNPKTNSFDSTARFDFMNRVPQSIHRFMWLFSDFGLSNGYRKMDTFTIHTFELVNKHGDSHFVRFNFRTEQGLEFLTDQAAKALRANDPDFSNTDLYDAIEAGNFPSWRLDMDVIPKHNIVKLNYNPFDLTILWRNGTYHTVTIGRLVLNRNPTNMFKDIEQIALHPGNLVPGIPGPYDQLFKVRRFSYRDSQNYRLGINQNNIQVNQPKYSKAYNRDGVPPLLDNMKDVPNYYQNSFNGPVPYVDVAKPTEALSIMHKHAVDLQEAASFYDVISNTEGKKNRLAMNFANTLLNTVDLVKKKALRTLYLVSEDLGRRTEAALPVARAQNLLQQPKLQVVEEYPRVLDLVPNVSN